MTMRISDAYTKLDRPTRTDGPANAGEVGTRAKESGRSATGSGAAVSTSVTLSARAQELASMADPSAARVSALRDKMSRGELRVDAQAIASKLIGEDT
jgi:flagellar biosynthesis anti-sigma factor FlgM